MEIIIIIVLIWLIYEIVNGNIGKNKLSIKKIISDAPEKINNTMSKIDNNLDEIHEKIDISLMILKETREMRIEKAIMEEEIKVLEVHIKHNNLTKESQLSSKNKIFEDTVKVINLYDKLMECEIEIMRQELEAKNKINFYSSKKTIIVNRINRKKQKYEQHLIEIKKY